VEIKSGLCRACIRVGRKAGTSGGCDLVVTDKDWDGLVELRKKKREALESLGKKDDELSAEQARLRAALDAVWKEQEGLKLKRRRLESEFVRLHAEQEAMSAREWASIAEVQALEEAEALKQNTTGGSPPVSSGVAPSSGPPVPASSDPLGLLDLDFDFDLPAESIAGRGFLLGELGDGIVGFVSSPS